MLLPNDTPDEVVAYIHVLEARGIQANILRGRVQRLVQKFKEYRDAPMRPRMVQGGSHRADKTEIATIRKTLNVVVEELEAALARAPEEQ